MVTTLNITLDDNVAERARQVKEERGLTWAEYIETAAAALAEGDADD
jgi:antitoxin component of RelBE/YafQ-DinJ toxin-antitoxin module